MIEGALTRGWEQLMRRAGGPLTFRLIAQPLVALFFAIREGWRDARDGRPLYFWTMLLDPTRRVALLRHGWTHVGKLFIAALALDAIYQLIEFHRIYPGQALIVAIVLAIIPYLIFRGVTNRVARRLRPRS